MNTLHVRSAKMASEFLGKRVPLQVQQSARGYYLGYSDEGGPVSRESEEYWPTHDAAEKALESRPASWTQRDDP